MGWPNDSLGVDLLPVPLPQEGKAMGLARVILVIQVPVFAGFGLAYRFRP